MELFRKICNFVALLINALWAILYFNGEFYGIDPFEFYFVTFLFLAGPWIVIHFSFVFIEYLKPKVESQIQDVQYSKSVKNKNYLVAFSEVEENRIENKELWAKAFAQCDGDTEKQKSIYVELRTKELSKR